MMQPAQDRLDNHSLIARKMRLLEMAKSGIPVCDIGRYCDYAGLNSFARSCHPIGLINAGDVEGAVTDAFEVGQLYQTANSRGLQWAAITAMAIAAATKPDATVESVLDVIHAGDPRFGKDFGEMRAASEIERGLERTKGCKDFREMRRVFDAINERGRNHENSLSTLGHAGPVDLPRAAACFRTGFRQPQAQL